ncbi:hypothetical protein YTPLAS18_16780 [Nitrospira sp.]|nr:hypothetical protein YTPLAS18_16780 [Nitrospira sp.]
MNLTLSIGGSIISIRELNGYPTLAWPLPPFEPFLFDDPRSVDLRVDLELVPNLPAGNGGTLRFDAGHGLWRLFETEAGLMLESLHTATHQPRARALVSQDYRTVRAWMLPEPFDGEVGWCPMYLFNPLIEVCFVSRLALDHGVLLHASGLLHRGHGFAFVGPSGAGKSTIARWFAAAGAKVLSDERILLRRRNGAIDIWGTPWVGSGEFAANARGELTSLYTIAHGNGHHVFHALQPGQVLPILIQQTILPQWDRGLMERTLDTLEALASTMPCDRLAALNRADVVDVVHARTSCPTGAAR